MTAPILDDAVLPTRADVASTVGGSAGQDLTQTV